METAKGLLIMGLKMKLKNNERNLIFNTRIIQKKKKTLSAHTFGENNGPQLFSP